MRSKGHRGAGNQLVRGGRVVGSLEMRFPESGVATSEGSLLDWSGKLFIDKKTYAFGRNEDGNYEWR